MVSLAVTHFVPNSIWSPDIWSPTIGPQLIGPSRQMVPNQFSPHGQMVPKNSGPNYLGIICPWGPNLMETVCPGGSILWGSFVQGDRKWGTRSPGIKWVQDQMRRSPILVWPENLIWFDPITLKQTLLLLRPQLEQVSFIYNS